MEFLVCFKIIKPSSYFFMLIWAQVWKQSICGVAFICLYNIDWILFISYLNKIWIINYKQVTHILVVNLNIYIANRMALSQRKNVLWHMGVDLSFTLMLRTSELGQTLGFLIMRIIFFDIHIHILVYPYIGLVEIFMGKLICESHQCEQDWMRFIFIAWLY